MIPPYNSNINGKNDMNLQWKTKAFTFCSRSVQINLCRTLIFVTLHQCLMLFQVVTCQEVIEKSMKLLYWTFKSGNKGEKFEKFLKTVRLTIEVVHFFLYLAGDRI